MRTLLLALCSCGGLIEPLDAPDAALEQSDAAAEAMPDATQDVARETEGSARYCQFDGDDGTGAMCDMDGGPTCTTCPAFCTWGGATGRCMY